MRRCMYSYNCVYTSRSWFSSSSSSLSKLRLTLATHTYPKHPFNADLPQP